MTNKKVGIVTGASRGIGAAVSKRLSSLDYDLVLIARNESDLSKVASDCSKNGSNVKIFKIDLSTEKGLKDTVNFISNNISRVDLLVNIAGVGIFAPIENFSMEEWNLVIDLNLKAPFFLIRAIVPIMKKQGGGHIINISSDADSIGFPDASVYCASKAGLLGLSQALSLELRKFKIKVCTISPGRVDTYFNLKNPGDREGALNPDDIAKLVIEVVQSSQIAMIKSIRIDSLNSAY